MLYKKRRSYVWYNERVNELGWQWDDGEINDLVEKEVNIYNEKMKKDFEKYLESYLFDKYEVAEIVQ